MKVWHFVLNALAVAVDGLCTIAGHVGRELAPHVKKHGSKLIPDSMKKDKDGRSNIDGAMVVAASGVQGDIQYGFVYHLNNQLNYVTVQVAFC